jgi:hypothetical protein
MLKKAAILIVMVLGTAIAGIVIGILGTLIGAWLVGGNDFGGFGELVGALLGMVFGYPAGVILGLVIMRYAFHRKGSVLLGAAGVVVGMALFFLLSEPLGLNLEPVFLWSVLLGLPPVMGTAGFLLGRGK